MSRQFLGAIVALASLVVWYVWPALAFLRYKMRELRADSRHAALSSERSTRLAMKREMLGL